MSSIKILQSSLLAIVLVGCAVPTSQEPRNLSAAKAELVDYVSSGNYQEDLAAAAVPAKSWISSRALKGGGKLAVVFDIDETTLSNLDHMKEADWGYQVDDWNRWMLEGTASAISPVREVYQTAVANEVTVFFITGRREGEKRATIRNLRAQGMGRYEEVILRSNTSKSPAATYKSVERKRITEKGYTIIANIGDQQSDLDGGYSERTFKLPNPFYRIP